MKNYELIEHTADIGIKVKGKDLKELFKNTGIALFDIIAEQKSGVRHQVSGVKKIPVNQKADNVEELYINWLNELLSLSQVKGVVFKDFDIDKIDNKNVQAVAKAEPASNYRFNTEVKAATYHDLKVEKTDIGWQAQVIFDV